MADEQQDSVLAEDANPFAAVRAQIKTNFEGFTDAQEETILDQLKEAYNAVDSEGNHTARDMIDAGLAKPNGFQIFNANNQNVISDLAERVFPDPTPTTPPSPQVVQDRQDFFNEQLSSDFALRGSGEVYISPYPAVADEKTGDLQTYTYSGATRLGETAVGQPPLRSLDHNGVVFDVPHIQTLLHEGNHANNSEVDVTPDAVTGRYFTPGIAGSPGIAGDPNLSVAQSYYGANEATSQKMFEEMGMTQFRGAYVGNWGVENQDVGVDYGLDRSHEVGVTTALGIDMTTQGPVDSVVVSLSQSELLIADTSLTPAQAATLSGAEFKMSDGNDTVHAFDGNDIVRTGDGDDRVFLGSGNDVAFPGWGNNTIDGGNANLDPASDHKSNTTTDWGIDSVDYTTLKTGFAAPDALSVDSSFDGVARDGVLITIDADEISVNKGQQYAPAPGEDIDKLHNIDAVKGSSRDDLAEVSELSGDQALDGAGGTDTLVINTLPDGSAATDVAGPVTFNGASYDGYVTDGTDKLYYKGIENVVVEQPEAATPPVTRLKPEISIEEAVETLGADQKALNRQLEETGVTTPATEAINHPDAAQMFKNLHENGVPSIRADVTSEMDPETRVGNLILAGREATLEAGIPMPHEQNLENARDEVMPEVSHQMPEPSYEEDYSFAL